MPDEPKRELRDIPAWEYGDAPPPLWVRLVTAIFIAIMGAAMIGMPLWMIVKAVGEHR